MMHDVVEIEDVECVGETMLAIRVLIDEKVVWIPKSVVHDDSEVWKPDQTGVLIVARWFAEKNSLV